MQNIQDLKEKIFFESKNMIAILDKISTVDELLSRQDLVDELANRISFLRLLEKNLEYFGSENFSSTKENSENFSSQTFIEGDHEIEEEAIFNNQLNEIGENEEYPVNNLVTEEEAIFNNQLNEIVEEELHETLVNFVEENSESEINSNEESPDNQKDSDIFNEQMEEIDEHQIPDNNDDALNFVDEERILANSEPENDDDIHEDMFNRENTEEEAVFNNQLNEIDEFENEISDDQGDLNDFDEEENIRNTFNSNIIGMILLTKLVFPHLKQGSSIINTTSATAYQGHEELLDYSATKGAIVSFTRSLALQSKPKGIRVNAVAPGPVATPLTKDTFGEEEDDPNKPPFERNATPEEVATSFLFLASEDGAQITGQVLHPNGGIVVNG